MGQLSAPEPYRSTPIFDEVTLPAALRREHRTKPGVWGVIRMIEGQLKLSFVDPPEKQILSPVYLQDNPLLEAPLRLEHIKPRLLGHWGTKPGLNFLYVHLPE